MAGLLGAFVLILVGVLGVQLELARSLEGEIHKRQEEAVSYTHLDVYKRQALPGPGITPYLVGLLVLLGMLGTFLGMVVTLNGAVLALESTTDLHLSLIHI